jgi:hypothetical protein
MPRCVRMDGKPEVGTWLSSRLLVHLATFGSRSNATACHFSEKTFFGQVSSLTTEEHRAFDELTWSTLKTVFSNFEPCRAYHPGQLTEGRFCRQRVRGRFCATETSNRDPVQLGTRFTSAVGRLQSIASTAFGFSARPRRATSYMKVPLPSPDLG